MDVGSNKSRKDTRAVVSLVARYRSPSTFEYVQEACCDVSVGGMFIKSTDPAAAGTLLKLECEADSNADKIRGVARVVWLRRDNNEYGPSGMGVKFVKLEPGSRETITRIVQENSAAGIEPLSMSSAPESRGKPPGVHALPNKDNGRSSSASAAHTAIAPSAPQTPVAPIAPSPVAPAKMAVPSPRPQVAAAVALPEVSTGYAPETSTNPGRSSRPEVVAAPPRSAIDTHSESAVPQEAFAAPPKSGGVRVGWLIAVAIAALVLYLVTKKDTSIPVETSPPAPTPATEPTGKAAPAAPESAKGPTAEAMPALPEPAQPSNPEAQAAQPQANPAEPSGQEPAKPEATAAAPEAEAKPAEPAAQAPAAATPETKPATEVAAANAAPAAQPATASATPPATPASDRPPLAPGQVPYIMSFVTRPSGASVTIGTQTVVAPGEMDLGAMPPRVRVTAHKEGYESSSVWLDRETEFVRSAGAMRRKVYLTLPALKPAADAPKP